MIPISHTVEEIVKRSPLVEEGLCSGIINLSALARQIRPEIEKRHLKTVTDAAILMALKRLTARMKRKAKRAKIMLKLREITVETNLTEYAFENSKTMIAMHRKLVDLMAEEEECMNYSQGIFETTVLVSSKLEAEVEQLAKDERLVSKISNICAITVRLPKKSVSMPGVYYPILKALAWENINLIEVISVFSELTLLFEEKDVDRAFSVIKALLR